MVAGFVTLFLGGLGTVVPLLPTTPLVILSAFCFSRSNKRLEAILLRSRLFGPFIENYRTKRGISKKRKIFTLVFLWVGLITSMMLLRTVWIFFLLLAVGIGVSTHILWMKTKE